MSTKLRRRRGGHRRAGLLTAVVIGGLAVTVQPSRAEATPPPQIHFCSASVGVITEQFVNQPYVGKSVEVTYSSAGACEVRDSIAMQQYLRPMGVGVDWGTLHVRDNATTISGELSTGLISQYLYECSVGEHLVSTPSQPRNVSAGGSGSSCKLT